jgi:SH3 domain protein
MLCKIKEIHTMLPKQTKALPASLSVLLATFILLLQFSAVLFSTASAQAETRYVKPSSEVVVRRGQGTEYKIIAVIKDGTSVELIAENEDFARVRLTNGKEGWMLKRFLSKEPPLNEIIASLHTEKEEIQQRERKISQQLKTVSAILARTEQERDSAFSERNQIQTSYMKLQQDTANVVQIKNNLQKTTGEKKTLTQKLALLEQENDSLKKNSALKWFLAGGGMLLFGMLIGRMSGGSRKRRTSLL